MKDGMSWAEEYKGNIDLKNLQVWAGGNSGFYTVTSTAGTFGPGKLTIDLFIGDKLVQEIECEVVNK
jgi:hypothetical protein